MGTVKLNNPNLASMKEDHLYHIGLNTNQNLEKIFGDVKFVVMGGSAKRMMSLAKELCEVISHEVPFEYDLKDISVDAERFSMFKVGPVITVNHGMGCPSISILLHEMIKLVSYAKCQDPIFIRLGTCGGLGVEPGTVCISTSCMNGMFEESFNLPILGKMESRPTNLDCSLSCELVNIAKELKIPAVTGKTMATDDFYEGQGRLDGASCSYSEKDKMDFLKKAQDKGCINIEMEGTVFAALTKQANIKSAIVCTAVINRIKGDQVTTAHETMNEWKENSTKVVSQLIKQKLHQCGSNK